jgi:hypothetical protein
VPEHTATPARADLEELGACEREEHRGRAADVGGQVLEEIELRVVGPVDVLEDE